MNPKLAIIYETSVANFFCSASKPIGAIEWTLNGTSLNNYRMDNPPKSTRGVAYGTLTFSGQSSRFNNTIVRCTVMISENKEVLTSDQSTFLVQGKLRFNI